MIKHKNSIFAAVILLAVLVGAWFLGAPPAAPQTPSETPQTLAKPSEPSKTAAPDGSFTVTLSVRCDTILDHMDQLDAEKHELVPPDGMIFPAAEVTAYEGESVFNVLRREMKGADIHMEFMTTPVYDSAYIEGIHNLYEFDAGELSGWLYRVNDAIPDYGCSRYFLKPGDSVEWVYTCDLGKDIDENWQGGLQKDE
ncbi:MAG: DUF4430 domain-containing protein [Clostridiales bacterium]|jgi:hypothetical protein|nr:DUF4430 domain-containing protein [Clostridiales bacterium]